MKLDDKTVRRRLLAQVHMAKKDLGLSDEAYRDLLESVTGKRSAADCSNDELRAVIEEFRAKGWKPRRRPRPGQPIIRGPAAPLVAKMRALWASLYQLGEVEDRSDKALLSFVKRQGGPDSLRWITPGDANKVIEALKDWCKRAGFEVPKTSGDGGLAARQRLAFVLWDKLYEIGAVRNGSPDALHVWISRKVSPHHTSVNLLSPAQLDEGLEKLGTWLRKEQAKRSA